MKAPRDWAGGILRNAFALVLLPFRPAMVLASMIFGSRKPTEHQTVYVVRVQQANGRISQVRIEHEIVGATVDLGDYVSIWGKERAGVIVVTRAYSHTVGAEVRLKPNLDHIVGIIVLCVVLFVVIFACKALYNS